MICSLKLTPKGMGFPFVHLENYSVGELVVTSELRDLIERNATWLEMDKSLTPKNFVSMASYARFLLTEGLVSPERVKEVMPRVG